jgi:transcriptional regulator with XRE-family HTH domain
MKGCGTFKHPVEPDNRPCNPCFGEVLRLLRRKHNKTLGEVARLMGWKVMYMSDIERGYSAPPTTWGLLRISVYFGCSPEEYRQLKKAAKGWKIDD